jgi:dTDP-4-dehydrorhamnose 3,5-epimerase
MIKGLSLTPLKIIQTPGGNVMHAMKKTDPGFYNFGEAYFSEIAFNSIKAWKRHKDMTLNLIVPVGEIMFVLFDDRQKSNNQFQVVTISRDRYSRLTVPPMVWLGFKGLSKNGSMLLNIASIEHDPFEVERKEINEILFNWDD